MAVLALVFATLAVVAPDGWIQAEGYTPDAVMYHPEGDASTFYLVVKSSGDAADALASVQIAGGYGTRVSETLEGSRDHIHDAMYEREDGRRTRIRTLRGTTETVIGVCHGSGEHFQACGAKITLLGVQLEELDTGYLGSMGLLILGVAIALGVIGSLGIWLIRKRRLATSPRLVEGEQLTISGTVRAAGTTFEAPLSGRRCVVHRSRARIVIRESLAGEPEEHQTAPFVVETKHGLVRIDDATLVVEALPDAVVDRGTERQRAFRDRHGVPDQASIAFSESVIEPGAKVRIRGIVALEQNAAATDERGYRDDAPRTITLVARAAQPITVLEIW